MSGLDAAGVALVRRILADAIEERPSAAYVRDLAEHIGELRQAIRSAVTVIDGLAGQEPEADR